MRSLVGVGLVWVAAATVGRAQDRHEETQQEIRERIREILQETLHGDEQKQQAEPRRSARRQEPDPSAQDLEQWGDEFSRQWEDWGRRFEKEWARSLEQIPDEVWQDASGDYQERWQEWQDRYQKEWEAWAEDYGRQWEEWGENYGEQWEDWAEQMEELGGDPDALLQLARDPDWRKALHENLKGLEKMPLDAVPMPLHLGDLSEEQHEALTKALHEHMLQLRGSEELLRRSAEDLARDVAGASGDARKLLEEKHEVLKGLSKTQWKELEGQLKDLKRLKERKPADEHQEKVERLTKEKKDLDARDAEIDSLRDEIAQLRKELQELKSRDR